MTVIQEQFHLSIKLINFLFLIHRVWLSEEEDEFIPFEHTVVSKFGPISRSARIKAKDTHPLQVQAAQVGYNVAI